MLYHKTSTVIMLTGLIILCICILYFKAKKLFMWLKVRNSHHATEAPKTFYEQCCAFISEMHKEESFFKLLEIKKRIDDFWGERTLTKSEYHLMVAVYRTYYARRHYLSPKPELEPITAIKIVL